MIGHQQIIDARRRGEKPKCIFVQYGMKAKRRAENDFGHPEKQIKYRLHPTVYIPEGQVPDVRFLSGCRVAFVCDEITPEARMTTQKIIERQPEMLMFTCLKTNQIGVWKNGEWKT